MSSIDPTSPLLAQKPNRIGNLIRLPHPWPNGSLINDRLKDLHLFLSSSSKALCHGWSRANSVNRTSIFRRKFLGPITCQYSSQVPIETGGTNQHFVNESTIPLVPA